MSLGSTAINLLSIAIVPSHANASSLFFSRSEHILKDAMDFPKCFV